MKYLRCVKKSYNIITIFALVVLFNFVRGQHAPASPCPEIFAYRYDGTEWFGVVELRGFKLGQTFILNINLSLKERLPTPYVGSLELYLTREETLQNIIQNKPVQYRIRFPLTAPLPRVTQILINNRVICNGPAEFGPLLTSIKLVHELYTQRAGQQLANLGPAPLYQLYIPNADNTGTIEFQPQGDFGEIDEGTIYYNQNKNTERPFSINTFNFGPQSSSNSQLDPPKRRPINPSQTQGIPSRPSTQSVNDQVFTSIETDSQLSPSKNRPTRPARPVKKPILSPTQSLDDRYFTSMESSNSQQPVQLQNINSVCGKVDSKFNVKPLIVGGDDIKRGSWPWLAAIYLNLPTSLSFRCGGNLVSDRMVITSAHCFFIGSKKYTANDVIVFLGRHNIRSWEEKGSIAASTDGIYTHPDYKNDLRNFDADIAVVLLRNEVRFTEFIRPVCLWSDSLDTANIEGEIGVVVGWGRNEAGQPVTSEPKRVETTIVSDVMCLRSNEQFTVLTSNRTFCAGNKDGHGPCSGDSGGGLILLRNNKWMLRGTVSASLSDPDPNKNSCNLDEFIVYADVASFLDWIYSFMRF